MNDHPRVAIFINTRLSPLYFSLQKDIINHRDIFLSSFFNNSVIFWIMNVYSDSSHSAIKYLKDTEVNLNNLLIMTRDFNIYDSLWDPSYNFHSSISNDLFMITNSFDLNLSVPINQVPTRYSDNANNSNSVIDLIFLQNNSLGIISYSIHPDWQLTLDHVPLTVTIPISKKHIPTHKRTLIRNSVEEREFIEEVITSFTKIDTSKISNILELEEIILVWANIVDCSWMKHSKFVNITKCSKSWWNDKCNQDLVIYRFSKNIESWKTFRKTVKQSKREFFDLKILEIANKKRGPWKLMNLVNKRKIPAIKTIKYNGNPCLELEDLWQALHSSFNSAQFQSINKLILNKCKSCLPME